MKEIKWYIVLIISAYVLGVTLVQRYKNPSLTETELFFLIPQNLVLDFKE